MNKRKPLSEETKRKISNSLMGHPVSEKVLKMLRSNRIGKNHSSETRAKMSQAQRREKHWNWKGGIIYHNGYKMIRVPMNCKFYSMTDHHGYIKMHRLVMAEYLQRPLKRQEIVHHINNIKDDNNIDNLRLFKNTNKHSKLPKIKVRIGGE